MVTPGILDRDAVADGYLWWTRLYRRPQRTRQELPPIAYFDAIQQGVSPPPY